MPLVAKNEGAIGSLTWPSSGKSSRGIKTDNPIFTTTTNANGQQLCRRDFVQTQNISMATTRIRRTFQYSSEGSSDEDIPKEMDEEGMLSGLSDM